MFDYLTNNQLFKTVTTVPRALTRTTAHCIMQYWKKEYHKVHKGSVCAGLCWCYCVHSGVVAQLLRFWSFYCSC